MQNKHQIYGTGIFFLFTCLFLLIFSFINVSDSQRVFAGDNKIDVGGSKQTGQGIDTQAILKTLKNNHWLKGSLKLNSVAKDGNYALVRFSVQDDSGTKWLSSALLKKSDSGWQYIDFSGGNPTTDFLKMNNIPQKQWPALLGKANIDKTADIMAMLKKRNEDMLHTNVNIAPSEDWALGTWLQDPAGGQTLLKKDGGQWKHIQTDGGAHDRDSLKKLGVPDDVIDALRGIEE